MKEHKPVPVALFIGVGIFIVFLAAELFVWFQGQSRGWSRDARIMIELCLLSGLLLCLMLVKYFEAVTLWVASLHAMRWLQRYDHNHSTKPGSAPSETAPTAFASLRDRLRSVHGYRWGYRDRWLLVSGDDLLIDRLAPGLRKNGYTIQQGTVLLHAGSGGQEWLKHIRRMRRHRPIDAMVAVISASELSTKAPDTEALDTDALVNRLAQQNRTLGFSAPAYVLNAVDVDGSVPALIEPVMCSWSTRSNNARGVEASLTDLSDWLADAGVQRLSERNDEVCLAQLSQQVARRAEALSRLVSQLCNSRTWRTEVFGVIFTPLFKQQPADATNVPHLPSSLAQPTWHAIAAHSRTVRGRHVGFSFSRVAAWSALALAAIWITGTLISVAANRDAIQTASTTIEKLAAPHDATQAAQTLDTLQKQIATLEARQHDGAPWYSRFGLNHDAALLSATWPAYEAANNRILIQPLRAKLEADLRQLGSLTDQELASGGDAQVKGAYSTLKSYLMLAEPQHADSGFLIPQLLGTDQPARPERSSVNPGNWRDLTQRLVAFHANHLRQRPSLAITPDATLIATARQTLVSVMGLQNSTDTVYQQILDETRVKYPPVSLQSLLGDTSSRGVFTTSETVPGVYTRQAWDERIGKAIDDADEQRTVTGDWVLSDTPTPSATASTASLKEQLRQRYFADYGRAWQQFLNSVHWQADTSLSGTVDQLSLYADPQRSPLSALFKVIVYQASTGAAGQSLSDTLVSKARLLVSGGDKDKDPSNATSEPEAPLASAFGPLLRVAGSDLATTGPAKAAAAQPANTSDISLPRYLERVTGVRLKLQQIMMSPDPDAMSRTAAQAILQGKTSDIGDSRDYASRVAASLGEQWSGFGNAVFQRPLDQTWDVVLQPATASLNETWRTAIVAAWNKSFGGRYPFADSDSDASLPEMARFLRVDSGVLSQFVSTQLGGIIERQGDQWVVMQATGRNTLRVDPEFVSALNRLTRVSNVLFPTGDASLRYELRAIPTPGITDIKIALSGRDLHYFNQREEWTPFVWPGDALENGTRIEWQTEQAGPRVAFDFAGRFGLIRLLERATVSQQDGARYLLRWPLGKEAEGVVPEAMVSPQAPVAKASSPEPSRRTMPRENDDWAARIRTSVTVPEAAWKPDESRVSRPSPQPLGPVKPRFLQVQLRSEVGAGPLDVLKLRHFVLPTRIFLRSDAGGRPIPIPTGPNPPPLPVTAIEAAKRASTPLPRGASPDIE
jgi:type VI secretion system protein ImpL